jgi:hypothetical protein
MRLTFSQALLRSFPPTLLGCFFAIYTQLGAVPVWGQTIADPPFGDTAGTVFDIITHDDPSVLVCVEPSGRGLRQIWDKRVDGEPVVDAHLFTARYGDGVVIEIRVNPEFSAQDAQIQALRHARPLGQLPDTLRKGIRAFSIHAGRKGFHAGTGQIVVYTETSDNRESYEHLEESLFHEAVHASWDADHRLAPGWIAAQKADGGFLTGYGQKSPEREDLAETALFAFAILHHPDRFPPADTEATLAAVPHRIAYIEQLLPKGVPLIGPVDSALICADGALR